MSSIFLLSLEFILKAFSICTSTLINDENLLLAALSLLSWRKDSLFSTLDASNNVDSEYQIDGLMSLVNHSLTIDTRDIYFRLHSTHASMTSNHYFDVCLIDLNCCYLNIHHENQIACRSLFCYYWYFSSTQSLLINHPRLMSLSLLLQRKESLLDMLDVPNNVELENKIDKLMLFINDSFATDIGSVCFRLW